MTRERTRRRYLRSLGVAGGAVLAGCSTDETEIETPTDGTSAATDTGRSAQSSTGQLPDWTQWIPADQLATSEDLTFAADLSGVRQEFSQDINERFDIAGIADEYGIAETDMETLVSLQGRSADSTVIVGEYDPAEIRSHLGISASETDTYQGFTVLTGGVAVGESAIVTSSYQAVLDTKFGETAAIGTADEDWATLLSLLVDGTIAYAGPGYTGSIDLTAEPTHTGGTIAGGSGNAVHVTAYYLFASVDQAIDVHDNDRQQILESSEAGETDFTSVERDGRILTITGTDENFEV